MNYFHNQADKVGEQLESGRRHHERFISCSGSFMKFCVMSFAIVSCYGSASMRSGLGTKVTGDNIMMFFRLISTPRRPSLGTDKFYCFDGHIKKIMTNNLSVHNDCFCQKYPSPSRA